MKNVEKGAAYWRGLNVLTGLFVAVLISSNLASTRFIDFFWGLKFDAGTLIFPLTYIFGDLLTEVYGLERSRRVIWLGFASLIICAGALALAGAFPPAEGWELDKAWDSVMGLAPRLALASLAAYLVGELANIYTLAALKRKTKGRWLAPRLILSTVLGQLLDTALFMTIAFAGVIGWELYLKAFCSNYIFKVALELLVLPLTLAAIKVLKKHKPEASSAASEPEQHS